MCKCKCIHICVNVHAFTYGVALTRRLLKIIGLFCKRALWKKLYSAKETYDFKEPTNRSHPICVNVVHSRMCKCHCIHIYMAIENVMCYNCCFHATNQSCDARTATHCNTLQHTVWIDCSRLQRNATHCNTLQRTATHCNTLQHTATQCNTLQHTATHCNALLQRSCDSAHGQDLLPRVKWETPTNEILPHMRTLSLGSLSLLGQPKNPSFRLMSRSRL